MAKILLVEDNELNRDMLSRRLERRGHLVLLAMDGEQGVALARSNRPDLLLIGRCLPVMDGWTATRILKEDLETRAIPVIGLTAYAMEGDRERCLASGCDDYETKPVEFVRLMGKIDELLVRAKGSASGPA